MSRNCHQGSGNRNNLSANLSLNLSSDSFTAQVNFLHFFLLNERSAEKIKENLLDTNERSEINITNISVNKKKTGNFFCVYRHTRQPQDQRL